MTNRESLIDALFNVSVFVFIGLLVWLYFKKEPSADAKRNDPTSFD